MANPPLIVGLLINGVAYVAIFMIVAFVISRFAGQFAWRSFLVLFLFIAAGLYIEFSDLYRGTEPPEASRRGRGFREALYPLPQIHLACLVLP